MNRILIVEDERRLTRFLVKGLRSQGFAPTVVEDGGQALQYASAEAFDLVVLDLGLPDIDGIEVLKQLRAQGETVPVLILSARDDLADKVAGLENGADDYVTKPFKFDELLARIRARLRVSGSRDSGHLEAERVSLDLRTRRATVDGRNVELTEREFTMLKTFLQHDGLVLSREQLLARVWGYDQDTDTKLVEVYISYLRKKLGNGVIETVPGVGYVVR